MSEARGIYAGIIDERLSTTRTVARIKEEASRLKAEGQLEVALGLIRCALEGSTFFPNHKTELREFRDGELSPTA